MTIKSVDLVEYANALEIPDLKSHAARHGIVPAMASTAATPDNKPADKPSAELIKGQVTAFTAGMTGQDKQDVEYTTLAAQLNSDVKVPDNQSYEDMQEWFKNYAKVLSNLGWVMSFEWEKFNSSSSGLSMDKVVLEVLAAVASQNGMAIAKAAMDAVSKLPSEDGKLKLFDSSTMGDKAGKFQLGVASKDGDSISLACGAFAMDYKTRDTTVLWFNWKSSDVNIYKDQKTCTFNQDVYANGGREALEKKLQGHVKTYVDELDLGF